MLSLVKYLSPSEQFPELDIREEKSQTYAYSYIVLLCTYYNKVELLDLFTVNWDIKETLKRTINYSLKSLAVTLKLISAKRYTRQRRLELYSRIILCSQPLILICNEYFFHNYYLRKIQLKVPLSKFLCRHSHFGFETFGC